MDLKQHLLRQMAFSHATFGPGKRTEGVCDHIRKELDEVIESGGSPDEWVDVVILALDGLTRSLAFRDGDNVTDRHRPHTVVNVAVSEIVYKQGVNEARSWPDWRTADKDKAIEHVKS